MINVRGKENLGKLSSLSRDWKMSPNILTIPVLFIKFFQDCENLARGNL